MATVTRVYRQAIDAYQADPENYTVDPAWHEELHKISHRPYTTGFFDGNPGAAGQVFDSSAQVASHEFVGVVRAYDEAAGRAVVEMRNRFAAGETLRWWDPIPSRRFTVSDLKTVQTNR